MAKMSVATLNPRRAAVLHKAYLYLGMKRRCWWRGVKGPREGNGVWVGEGAGGRGSSGRRNDKLVMDVKVWGGCPVGQQSRTDSVASYDNRRCCG